MLQLKNITKNYYVGDITVNALKNVSMNFRENEFVSILGASGCGKTTLLNIIGGLDRYTDGDIIINGTSTKDYKDKDWDSYRNHSVGFVFQSYNLIPHQTVLQNVELALTLSGIKREERRERAKAALEKVGLGDQFNKRPNQMSGGQMQRVAIARAIVNDPDIILADEPTGALDTETSVQVMEILKELSLTKLVIMVTHNPELAEKYSTRIIRLHDGTTLSDTMPFDASEEKKDISKKAKKPSMKFWTALSLSLNNLLTKKARTLLTSFAGSIGIIGIALILSLSAGFNSYIAQVQQETLTSYPITINKTNVDLTTMVTSMMGEEKRDTEKYPNSLSVTSQNTINNMIEKMAGNATRNDLVSFKKHVDENLDQSTVSGIQYSYDINFSVYKEQNVKTITSFRQVEPVNLPEISELVTPTMAVAMQNYYEGFGSMLTSQAAWTEMIDNKKLIESQYDYLKGGFPTNENEMLLVVDEYNQISDLSLYMIGLMDDDDLSFIFNSLILKMTPNADGSYRTDEEISQLLSAQGITRSPMSYSFDELMNLEYSVALDTEKYEKDGSAISNDKEFSQGLELQTYKLKSANDFQTYLSGNDSAKLKISGIVRLKEGISNGALRSTLNYTKQFTKAMIARNNKTDLVKDYIAEQDKAPLRADKLGISSETYDYCYYTLYETIKTAFDAEQNPTLTVIPAGTALTQTEYEQFKLKTASNPVALSLIDEASPSAINLYPISFEEKDKIIAFIDDYNKNSAEDKQIKYTDLIGLMMSSITIIINAITYVLIAFVSISLIVSSIMIGIITYISVLERTKEIGVLRSIGASKRDVKRVFNAETIIIGLFSGLMGIGISLLLNIPINIIINHLANISNVASLPVWGGIGLIVISVLLTTIAGLFPASIASKKDPVVALRTE